MSSRSRGRKINRAHYGNGYLGFFGRSLRSEQKGTRLIIVLEDKPGQLHGILEVIKNVNVNIIAVVTPTFKVQGKRLAAVRVETQDYRPS